MFFILRGFAPLLILFAVFGGSHAGHPSNAPVGSGVYDAGNEQATPRGNTPISACLIAQGYHGNPDDGKEWIYAPQDEIDACTASAQAISAGCTSAYTGTPGEDATVVRCSVTS